MSAQREINKKLMWSEPPSQHMSHAQHIHTHTHHNSLPQQFVENAMVEVLGDNGAHYNAFVCDVEELNNDMMYVTLAFPNDWCPMQRFPINRIRLPPRDDRIATGDAASGDKSANELSEGSVVEVMAKSCDSDEYGFWKATIQMINGNYYVVSYVTNNIITTIALNDKQINGIEKTKSIGDLDLMSSTRRHSTAQHTPRQQQQQHLQHHSPKSPQSQQTFNEIVTKERIRAINTNPHLCGDPFYRVVVDVPKDIAEKKLDFIANNDTHKQFKKSLGVVSVKFEASNWRLICIGYAEKDKEYMREITKSRATMLSEMHFRSLRQKLELMAKNEVFKNQLRSMLGDIVNKIGENQYEIIVRVSANFVGLAIGRDGANLKQILAIDGVLSVENLKGIFRVRGKSYEACLRARDMLQYMEVEVEIPRQFVGHTIGKNGRYIQEIINKSGIYNVTVKGDKKDQELTPAVSFVFLGTCYTIENAKILLRYHLNSILETDKNGKIIDIIDQTPTRMIVK